MIDRAVAVAAADAYTETGGAWAAGPEVVYGRLATVLLGCSPVPMAGRWVVDLGAGTGAATRAAQAAGAADVVAVDAALGMLRHDAARRSPAAVADALALPLRTGALTGAVAAFSLNHLTEPADGLRELARVVAPGSPILAAVYAADDRHPVKAAVEHALARRGWEPPAWYDSLRTDAMPRLATEDGCRAALEAAGLGGATFGLRVPFPELGPEDLVRWRLGMAQHAPFVARLGAGERRAVVEEVLDDLGPEPEELVRSVLVLAAVRP